MNTRLELSSRIIAGIVPNVIPIKDQEHEVTLAMTALAIADALIQCEKETRCKNCSGTGRTSRGYCRDCDETGVIDYAIKK